MSNRIEVYRRHTSLAPWGILIDGVYRGSRRTKREALADAEKMLAREKPQH